MSRGDCERCGEQVEVGNDVLCDECIKEVRKIEWDEEHLCQRVSRVPLRFMPIPK
jgi:NMD protein affecting ribosome stability and mRNA decay